MKKREYSFFFLFLTGLELMWLFFMHRLFSWFFFFLMNKKDTSCSSTLKTSSIPQLEEYCQVMRILRFFFSLIKPRNVKLISSSHVRFYEEKENAGVSVPMAMTRRFWFLSRLCTQRVMAVDSSLKQTAGSASRDRTVAWTKIFVGSALLFSSLLILTCVKEKPVLLYW